MEGQGKGRQSDSTAVAQQWHSGCKNDKAASAEKRLENQLEKRGEGMAEQIVKQSTNDGQKVVKLQHSNGIAIARQ